MSPIRVCLMHVAPMIAQMGPNLQTFRLIIAEWSIKAWRYGGVEGGIRDIFLRELPFGGGRLVAAFPGLYRERGARKGYYGRYRS